MCAAATCGALKLLYTKPCQLWPCLLCAVYKAQRSKAKLASYTKAAQLLQRAGQLRAELRGSALEKFR